MKYKFNLAGWELVALAVPSCQFWTVVRENEEIKPRMLLSYLTNGKISIIVFIAEEICSWLSHWLAEKTKTLSVYRSVTAKKWNMFLQR